MQIRFQPAYSEQHGMCFADVEIIRNDGAVVFSTNQQTDGISLITVATEYFAEVDIPEFQAELLRYFGASAEFSSDTDFRIHVQGQPITDDALHRFLIHAVDECGFMLGMQGPIREFQPAGE